MSREPSVLPLSAIRISPEMPARARYACAFLMQAGRVRASLRQGIRTVRRTGAISHRGWDGGTDKTGRAGDHSAALPGGVRFRKRVAVPPRPAGEVVSEPEGAEASARALPRTMSCISFALCWARGCPLHH